MRLIKKSEARFEQKTLWRHLKKDPHFVNTWPCQNGSFNPPNGSIMSTLSRFVKMYKLEKYIYIFNTYIYIFNIYIYIFNIYKRPGWE